MSEIAERREKMNEYTINSEELFRLMSFGVPQERIIPIREIERVWLMYSSAEQITNKTKETFLWRNV